MEFLQSLPLPAVIVLVALVVMYVMIARWESAYKTSHMGYSKDEWEGFIARYGYSRKQIQNICNYYGRDFPKNDEDWIRLEARMSLDLAEASMCHSSEDHEALCDFVIDGKGLGHWVQADTSTEVTPPRLGETA
jgi:hypothetical protein|tara:strand:- start:302 stop:703 length:402 start_codon:yes stop_codon:yes gene_type:complete